MATGFQSNQAKPPAHADTNMPHYGSVAEYMDTVNTVNLLYISFSTISWTAFSFRC